MTFQSFNAKLQQLKISVIFSFYTSIMSSFLLQMFAPIVGSIAVEEFLIKKYLPIIYSGLFTSECLLNIL